VFFVVFVAPGAATGPLVRNAKWRPRK